MKCFFTIPAFILLVGCNSISKVEKLSSSVNPVVRVMPQYPAKAFEEQLSGYVRAKLTIDKDGKVDDINIIESYPSDIFNKEAVNALKKWRYKPEDVAEKGTQYWVETQLNWNHPDNKK